MIEDTGYRIQGYRDTGYRDTGYRDAGIQDKGYRIRIPDSALIGAAKVLGEA